MKTIKEFTKLLEITTDCYVPATVWDDIILKIKNICDTTLGVENTIEDKGLMVPFMTKEEKAGIEKVFMDDHLFYKKKEIK